MGFNEATVQLYQQHLPGSRLANNQLRGDCPFCREKGFDPTDNFLVYLNKEGFFFGYFRCLNRCVPGGFPLWFARLAGFDPSNIPGFDPDREILLKNVDYPAKNLNHEITVHTASMTDGLQARFQEAGVRQDVLLELGIGFNGRYLVYPYFQDDGNCYAAHCVFPDRIEDSFWHGNEDFFTEQHRIFNVQDIARCENGALFLCVGEESLLVLKQLGYPAVAVPDLATLEALDSARFAFIKTLFLVTSNSQEADVSVRVLASRLGYKVRPFRWPAGLAKEYNLWQMAKDKGDGFRAAVSAMIAKSRAFSPFITPTREYENFREQLSMEGGSDYGALRSGFSLLDGALGGIHGINIIGGAPKTGKSTFLIQMATEMALRKIPVLYYDFENGRQKIYQRSLCRLSRLAAEQLRSQNLTVDEKQRFELATQKLQKMLHFFRVINDRQVSPEIMRRHIDFIRHETNSQYTVVVIDSLHKLPFKDFSERRTGIDAWLRQMESIRDELRVSFLVVSELSRGDGRSYKETPHLGVFKGSGDIEYSADNAMVLYPDWEQIQTDSGEHRKNRLWLVASREQSPGLVADYVVDYPYWGFTEHPPTAPKDI
jgi:replicative DNA helicase